MSKKDFIALALADALKESRPLFGQEDQSLKQWNHDVETVRRVCAMNPRFNSQRWLDYIAGKCGKNGGRIAA